MGVVVGIAVGTVVEVGAGAAVAEGASDAVADGVMVATVIVDVGTGTGVVAGAAVHAVSSAIMAMAKIFARMVFSISPHRWAREADALDNCNRIRLVPGAG